MSSLRHFPSFSLSLSPLHLFLARSRHLATYSRTLEQAFFHLANYSNVPRWHCSSQTTKIEIEKRDGFRKLKFDLISRVLVLVLIVQLMDLQLKEFLKISMEKYILEKLNREWRRSYLLKNSIKFRLNVNK